MLSIALRSFVTGIAPVARSVGMRSLAIAIKVQGEDGVVRDVAGKPDQTLLEACQAANVPLGGTCGGNQACGTCHVFVEDKYVSKINPMEDDEKDTVDKIAFKTDNSRLGCSIKLTPELDGMKVTHKPKTSKKKADSGNKTQKAAPKVPPPPPPVTKPSPQPSPQPSPSNAKLEFPVLSQCTWVGALDTNVRDFHGYNTPSGSTYNSFLIKSNTSHSDVLVDAVKYPFANNLLDKLSLAQADISHIIVNHAEPDHCSSMPAVMNKYPKAQILCTKACAEIMSRYFNTSNWNIQAVGDGETKTIGGRSYVFYHTPLDSMATYMPESKTLLSMDAFGQHIASSGRSDVDVDVSCPVPLSDVMHHAKVYYANILNPLHKPVKKALDKLAKLPLEWILPAHGRAWHNNVKDIITAYNDWTHAKPTNKVSILYDTMWGSTKLMAEAIAEGCDMEFRRRGINGKVVLLCCHNGVHHNTDIVTELMDSAAIAIGSPVYVFRHVRMLINSLNGRMMPDMSSALTYAGGLKVGRAAFTGITFGCYGWQGDVVAAELEGHLTSWGVKTLLPRISSFHKPDASIIESCVSSGRQLVSNITK